MHAIETKEVERRGVELVLADRARARPHPCRAGVQQPRLRHPLPPRRRGPDPDRGQGPYRGRRGLLRDPQRGAHGAQQPHRATAWRSCASTRAVPSTTTSATSRTPSPASTPGTSTRPATAASGTRPGRRAGSRSEPMTTDRGDHAVAVPKRKLIEVALPLEAINRESAREKSIRHGHPSTLHLWWARRPLAAARAVLFAQLVDDPSSHPDRFPTEEAQRAERERLHGIIERLVVWENTRDQALLAEAHAEILKSTGGNPPPILDPFAGGGTIPLEAQRLGLEAHASDLNPVAVLINKALIEIPPKFAGRPPVFPGLADSRIGGWEGATGLAADVRAYGEWMRDEAERRIGEHYPQATLEDGTKATVIAWIWARTVTCPNPRAGSRCRSYALGGSARRRARRPGSGRSSWRMQTTRAVGGWSSRSGRGLRGRRVLRRTGPSGATGRRVSPAGRRCRLSTYERRAAMLDLGRSSWLSWPKGIDGACTCRRTPSTGARRRSSGPRVLRKRASRWRRSDSAFRTTGSHNGRISLRTASSWHLPRSATSLIEARQRVLRDALAVGAILW